LWNLYDKATNKDNADRDHFKTAIKDEMHGRMINEIQSYDYLENAKYKRCEKLLTIMNENFCFEDPVMAMEKYEKEKK
jgi:hypothetical protein